MTLSFCIPTYNRKNYLEETLASILCEGEEGIEIVISDNASSDGTEERVAHMQQTYPHLIYFRWPHEVSCGENLLNTLKLARSKYCWLMTDDDRVEEGGLKTVLKLLKEYPDVTGISVNVEGYDEHFKRKKQIRYSHRLEQDTFFENAEKAFAHLGAWWGFWSAHIVHRLRWHEAARDKKRHAPFMGYHHLSIMTAMVLQNPQWLFTAKRCVGYRANHESFSKEYGRLKRFEIDAFAYTTVGKDQFPLQARRHVHQLVLNNLVFWQLVSIKCENTSVSLLKDLFKVGMKYYRSYLEFWCKIVPLLIIPTGLLKALRHLYRRIKDATHSRHSHL